MRFARWPYGERLANVEDFERLNAEQAPQIEPEDVMTLFPDMAPQPCPRAARWSPEARYLRARRAQEWREIRRVLFGLPQFSRSVILDQWAGVSARRCYAGTPDSLNAFLLRYFPYLTIEKSAVSP